VIDESHGENVCAYVEVKANVKKPKSGELIRFAKQRVGYKAPEEIIFIERMPLNPTGKVDRVALKKTAAGEYGHYV
jgi:long-chain acyl-CoA synthetase